jgi:DNA helicase II / ATP-dependent DNA helicase PcrA
MVLASPPPSDAAGRAAVGHRDVPAPVVGLPASVARRLAGLTADQRAAATAPPGPVLCVAPAGSGKTTTVVARLAWRVAGGSPPGAICALTFNRRAAEELQDRVDKALGELGIEPRAVRIRTFHALGREILAEAGRDVSAIVSRADVLAELAGGPLPAASLRRLDDAFTRFKLDPERGPAESDVQAHAAYQAYRRELDRRGALDLDDLVALAGPTLAERPELLRRWRARCAVLFVDEAQDLDRAQLDLAVTLAGPARDIFLVGDDDQTIYAWRLADVRRVLGLAARLPGLRRVDLETNHRCAPEIVHRAARLVAHNRERFEKRIRASPSADGWLALAPDPGDEVARARRLLAGWATGDGPRAVLARTNRELSPYAAVALELGLPHRVEEDGLVLDDPLVDVVVAQALGAQAATTGTGPAHPLVALRQAARAVGCPPSLASSLLAWAAPYPDLRTFSDALAARRHAREALRRPGAALTFATVHGTKGLEWDHVACVGFDDGVFPSARALAEAADPARVLEEERRLCYVAWTRARRSLVIVYDPASPSVFLREAFEAAELAPPVRKVGASER